MAENNQASSVTAAPAVTTPPPAAPAVAPAADPSARNLNNPAGQVATPAASPATAPAVESEKKPEEASNPPPAKKPASGDFLRKMQKEAEYRETERKAKAALADLQKREAEWKQRQATLGDPRTDPIAYLEKMGVPFDEVVKHITSREPPKVEDKVSALEKQLQDFRREQEENAKQEAQRRQQEDMAEFQRQTVEYVKRNADKHELISAFNAEGYVPQMISEYARAYNKVLDVDEAASYVEEELASVIEKVTATKWFKSKYAQSQPAAPVAPPAKVVDSGKQGTDAKTLTSSATATAAAVEQARKPMTEAEARAKAIEILNAHMKRGGA